MNGHDIINLAAYYNIRCDIWLSEQRGIDAAEPRSVSSEKENSIMMAYCR